MFPVPREQTLSGGTRDCFQEACSREEPAGGQARRTVAAQALLGRAPALLPAVLLCAGAAAARRPSLTAEAVRAGSRCCAVQGT